MYTNAQLRTLLNPSATLGSAVNVTGATNATPVVVSATAHGLASGDIALVQSVGGNTNANGIHRVTVSDANTFSLDDVAGNAAYTTGGTVIKLTTPVGFVKNLTVAQLDKLKDTLNRIKNAPSDTLDSVFADGNPDV